MTAADSWRPIAGSVRSVASARDAAAGAGSTVAGPDVHARTSAAAAAPPAADVVFAFSYMTWSAAAKRGWFGTEDRLARALVAREDLRRVLVCDRVRSLPLKLIRDLFSREAEPFPASERAALLAPVRLRRTDPTSLSGVERMISAYDRVMEKAAWRMGLDAPIVITTHPLLAGFGALSWARSVTFYALDDWATHPGYSRWWDAYRESYLRIRQSQRRVAAVSRSLLERLAPSGPGTVVPNGLEPAEWLGSGHVPNVLAGVARPLLVYAGTLDRRLDVDWIIRTAEAIPAGTVVLAGPVGSAEHLEPLRRVANVKIVQPLARTELAGLIRHADVGLVPHERSALTEAMSPLKLYEYLAGGLPVAATDLEPMRGVDRRVVLVPERGDFVAGVRSALALGRADERERIAFVRANSWRSRHDALLRFALD